MILCCANCEEPIPARRGSDMFCSVRCETAFADDLLADWDDEDDDT